MTERPSLRKTPTMILLQGEYQTVPPTYGRAHCGPSTTSNGYQPSRAPVPTSTSASI